MINLFFVIHDFSGARTYSDELLGYFLKDNEIVLHKIFFGNKYHKEFTVKNVGKITEIYFPFSNNIIINLMKYSIRCIDLIEPVVASKENVIFHINFFQQISFGIEAKKRFDAKLIYTLHILPDSQNNIEENYKYLDNNFLKIKYSLDKEIFIEADTIICVTQHAKKFLVDQYNTQPEKIKVIYNGYGKDSGEVTISELKKNKLKEELGFNANNQIILFVGRLVTEKGINQLLNVFNDLSKKLSNLQLVIVGEGDFGKILSICNNNWGRITLTGKITYDKIIQLYQIADIGIIPSHFEQCSYVALEMMQNRLSIIANKVPGLEELFQHNHDSLLHDSMQSLDKGVTKKIEINEKKLKIELSELLSNKELKMKLGKNAELKWRQYYTAKRMGQQTLKIYKEFVPKLILKQK